MYASNRPATQTIPPFATGYRTADAADESGVEHPVLADESAAEESGVEHPVPAEEEEES